LIAIASFPFIVIANDGERRDAVIPILERNVCERDLLESPDVAIDHDVVSPEVPVVEDPNSHSAKDSD